MKRILIPGILTAVVILSACSSGGAGQAGKAPDAAETVSEVLESEPEAAATTFSSDKEPITESAASGQEQAAGQAAESAGADQFLTAESAAADPTPAAESAAKPAAEPLVLDSNEALKAARTSLYEEMCAEAKRDADRAAEVEAKSMTYGEATMRYSLATVGEDSGDGYPVYIALHGGGEAEKELNDSQWVQMQVYYYFSVKNGIYIATRGVRDTWNTHFNPESYPLYERLLENLSIFYPIDTNRVYLMGYSAGGDGVYQISPRLADRFAAVNMSAGHPNGVNLANLYNTPIALQCGEKDTAYDRNLETAKYDAVLNELADRYGRDGQPEGYTHRTFLHLGKGHAVVDNDKNRVEQTVISDLEGWLETGRSETEKANTNAVDFVTAYTRDPIPERIVWDLSVRTEESDVETFYWLRAPRDVTEGVVVASYDKETNTIHIEQNTANGPVYAMVNDDMLDIFSDINVTTADGGSETVTVTPSEEYIRKTIEERWDENMIFVGELALPACGE